MSRFRLLQLHWRLQLGRQRVVHVCAPLLLVLGIAADQLWLPRVAAETQRQRQELAVLQLRASVERPAPALGNKQALGERDLYEQLGDAAHVEQVIEALLSRAAKRGLTIQRVDYKSDVIKEADIATYQLSFTSSGPYRSLRQFCEDFLREVPFASLDDISFKRDSISSPKADAKMRFTLYLDNARAALGTPTVNSLKGLP